MKNGSPTLWGPDDYWQHICLYQNKFSRVTKNKFSLYFEWFMWRLSFLNSIHAFSINFVQQSKFYNLGWYIFSIRKAAGTLVLPQKPASWALALQTLHWRCEYLLHWYTLHWRALTGGSCSSQIGSNLASRSSSVVSCSQQIHRMITTIISWLITTWHIQVHFLFYEEVKADPVGQVRVICHGLKSWNIKHYIQSAKIKAHLY